MIADSDSIPAFNDLKALIQFPTVSTTSNTECCRWIEKRLEQLGFETEFLSYTDQWGEQKSCISGCLRPANDCQSNGRGLAYFCHNDVVPVDSWSFPDAGPWQATRKDDRIYGRGSCDMKGSLACLLAAVEQSSGTLTAPLYVFCTADEEVGFHGARKIANESSLYKEVVTQQINSVIGEPTELRVVHAHKGGRILQFTAQGRAAHSSTTEGINANFLMIPFLNELNQLLQHLLSNSKYHDDRFDPSSITPNLILNDHTPAVNMTPAQSVATVYFRTMPDIDVESIVKQLLDLAKVHQIKAEKTGGGDPVFTNPTSPFVQQLLKLTGTAASETVSYGTDGGCFSELKNIVIFGPGSIRQAHTDDEYISIQQLQLGVDMFEKLIALNCQDAAVRSPVC
ncbi:MAG: M20 family metallopeptidase [Fuerstiella sp.]